MAVAGGTPANKMMASGSKRVVVGENQTEVIMQGVMRTSKPKDVIMQVALECSILTKLTTNNANPTASASGKVRVWVTVDGKVVPIEDVSTAPQDPAQSGNGTVADDSVTFCDREYSRSVTDQETLPDGIDQESDYIRTKSSHGFNWIRLNMGSGVHDIKVFAQLTRAQSATGEAEATIGNRTLVAEPGHFDVDAVIAETGSQ